MLKKELRQLYSSKRQTLSQEIINELSIKIFELLISNFDLNNKKICCFMPIKTKNEINSFILLKKTDCLNFELSTTKWNQTTNDLSTYKITSKTIFEVNKYNIPEPTENYQPITYNEIDLILVPLLIFDLDGHRVGYGKGVYDQFLKNFKNNQTKKIGLSLFEPIKKIDDIIPTDIKLDLCITPRKIYKFEK